MGSLRLKGLWLLAIISSLWGLGGCGGHHTPGVSLFPARVNLNPGNSVSLQLGSVLSFSASAQNATGGNVNASFTFTSSDTSILNIAPGGFACAGLWNTNYTVCTPGATGVVQVTATTSGVTSAPTYVFVHPAIDTVTVTGVLLDGIPIQEPCLSQSQSMTVQAAAFSQGTDITSAVGPFTWSANNPSVVKITPLVNTGFNFPTNQATITAVTPGITQIYASASGAYSTTFQQPQYQNAQGVTSPALDFFATCNIQNITLDVGPPGVQQSGQTSFTTGKGTTENATAVVTDVAGNTSLANTNGQVVLTKIPLTWTASQPGVLATGAGCTLSCTLTTPSAGAGVITASCSPPTCNIGFPQIPTSLTGLNLTNCSNFFKGAFASNPNFTCDQLIPVPVYSLSPPSPPPPLPPIPQTGGISGLVTGTTSAASVLATSTGCASEPPATCTTGLYSFATSKAQTGSVSVMPTPANSLLFDLAGDKAFMGSEFGAQIVNPANFATNNSPYTPLGTITGQVLAVSNNGTVAVISDTVHTPNQVYIVNTASSNALSASALNINGAVAAGFSPDGLKTFILGDSGSSLYVYSQLQALQGPFALAGRGNTVAFSPNGAFAFVTETSLNNSTPNLTAYNVCDNQVADSPGGTPAIVDLPADPLFAQVLPGVHIPGRDSLGNAIPDGIHILLLDSTGVDILTATNAAPPSGSICSQGLTFISGAPTLSQRIELGQGTIQPVNLFTSADQSLLYVPASNLSSLLVYSFITGSVTGIQLRGNASPVTAAMTVDAGTILVAANDGMLHEISTALGGADLIQLPFPDLPNYLNPFCTFAPNGSPACALDLVAVKP